MFDVLSVFVLEEEEMHRLLGVLLAYQTLEKRRAIVADIVPTCFRRKFDEVLDTLNLLFSFGIELTKFFVLNQLCGRQVTRTQSRQLEDHAKPFRCCSCCLCSMFSNF